MSHKNKILLSILLCFMVFTSLAPVRAVTAKGSASIEFVILSNYKTTLDIGDEFYLLAITSNGAFPTWKSSSSKIASVNTYGKVTAKKSGTALITAKIKNGEASCKVTVNKTKITISKTSVSLERGETLTLSAAASNHSKITWKSNRTSIAAIDENGNLTGNKPGEATISASADGSSADCKVTVKRPVVKLTPAKITLYRGQTASIHSSVSSGVSPVWKTNKKSVALVDETGTITAVKHGTALITAAVDGVTRTCEITVKQPTITLSDEELTLAKGKNTVIKASVSSGNQPAWSSSNQNIATVNASGTITALKKGRAYIYASEDGIKVKCTVYVTE